MKRNLHNPDDFQMMLRRIHLLTPDHERLWGTMTANEMLCHVADQLRVAMQMIESKDRSTFLSRNFTKWYALWKKDIPRGKVKTVREMNPKKEGTQPVSLEDDRVNLVKLMNAFVEKETGYEWQNHPMFGKLSGKQWGRLAYNHLDHHLKQFGI